MFRDAAGTLRRGAALGVEFGEQGFGAARDLVSRGAYRNQSFSVVQQPQRVIAVIDVVDRAVVDDEAEQ